MTVSNAAAPTLVHAPILHVSDVLDMVPNAHWRLIAERFVHTFQSHLSALGEASFARFLLKYGRFNSAFAGSGLSLAGTIHLRGDLFGEERASEISAYILLALIDEYIDRTLNTTMTHRALCLCLMKSVGEFLEAMQECAIDKTLEDFRAQITAVYATSLSSSDWSLFVALGFHFAAEMNGAIEFALLEKALKNCAPGLTAYLKREEANAKSYGYRWITDHVVLERAHFLAALSAISLARQSYKGTIKEDELVAAISTGVQAFYGIAEKLMS